MSTAPANPGVSMKPPANGSDTTDETSEGATTEVQATKAPGVWQPLDPQEQAPVTFNAGELLKLCRNKQLAAKDVTTRVASLHGATERINEVTAREVERLKDALHPLRYDHFTRPAASEQQRQLAQAWHTLMAAAAAVAEER